MTGAMELQPDDGPRSSLSIGPGFERCSGISLEFARRFAEGIGKLARNMSGDRRKKTRRLTARISEAAGLVGSTSGSRPSPNGSLSLFSIGSITRSWPFLQRCSRLHGAQMTVEGAIGLDMASQGVTLVLHTSWFNHSSWICTKEIAVIRVYGCRVFTSP
ncbi:hypothetical protein B296_00020538 [Ensete ventricosum]|uniref:Uncharacterized protein n=1 Tax=Ensete ventricosum TaxID=4639 RepID=A0A426XJB2_ENSVE|nr:hypothetical protein B296_00020538 [Ensete ventricosum]